MSRKAFDKFIYKEPTGAAKKEMIKVEKRRAKADARAAGEELRRKKKEKKLGIVSQDTRPTKEERKSKKPHAAGYKKQDSKFKGARKNKFEERQKDKEPTSKFNQDSNFKNTKEAAKPLNASLKKTEDKFSKPDAKPTTSGGAKTHQPIVFKKASETEQMPLNKFVSHAGVCGRREAAEIIKQGLVTVNGEKIIEPSFRVNGKEDIQVKGKRIFPQHNLVYFLVNKPKDYITTSKDPEGRKTIMDLMKSATTERIYPVGRLDRNTTGVLLMTNDGELAQKLTHPSFEIKKIYEVKLDKVVTKKDIEAIADGITLDDGFIQADSVAYVDSKDKSLIGIEIHSGKNRIVRRIFEHLGYDVRGLDRVMFANLTKKNVDRGKYRSLTEKEVRLLKFMNQSFVKKGTAKNASTNAAKHAETED